MSSFDTGTKNLPYRPGFPTPVALPDTTACRVFRIPADDENGTWQATFMGLLMYLTDAGNWVQQDGGLDAETCAERWLEMLDNAYDTAEAGCAVTFPAPGDEQVPVFRLNASTGHLEQLNEQQEWEAPAGAYAVPAVPAREGSEIDAKCLAAANCANVLETLYETIVDGIASDLTDAEILEAIITEFVIAVGWGAAAGILFSLGFIGLVVIGAVIAVVALLASDVWDETFTDTLRCILYNCATYDAGVVTFDYECVVNALAAQTDLTLDQLRLFGQLVFIINAVGGADGLNQAGTTTEITEATCDACANLWCWRWGEEFGLFSDDWTIFDIYGSIEDNALLVNQLDEDSYSLIALLDAFDAHVTSFTVTIYAEGTPTLGVDVLAWGHYDGSFHEAAGSSQDLLPGTNNYVFTLDSDETSASQIYINPNGGTLTNVKVLDFYLSGTGDRPFGTDNNCTP